MLTINLFVSFKAIQHFNDVWMVEITHNQNLATQIFQLFIRSAHFRNEFKGNNLSIQNINKYIVSTRLILTVHMQVAVIWYIQTSLQVQTCPVNLLRPL